MDIKINTKTQEKIMIKIGDIYKSCNYIPVRCEGIDEYDGVWGVSLVDGSRPHSCDIYNCGPVKISEEEAQKLIQLWNTEGERGVLLYEGWTPEAIDQFIKKWR
ncbi:MAG TPA: hypothetical protein VJN02_12745 [Gammaproteobacteria bacterium]|nr:hypothetical protein [Gammaproteobacteria bacterium]